jgi:hypothetical protein
VVEQNTSGECHHYTDAERALRKMWVIDRGEGYRILEIHEFYQYQVTQYNRETGEGGLFVECINTFLKLKAEASG